MVIPVSLLKRLRGIRSRAESAAFADLADRLRRRHETGLEGVDAHGLDIVQNADAFDLPEPQVEEPARNAQTGGKAVDVAEGRRLVDGGLCHLHDPRGRPRRFQRTSVDDIPNRIDEL